MDFEDFETMTTAELETFREATQLKIDALRSAFETAGLVLNRLRQLPELEEQKTALAKQQKEIERKMKALGG